MKAGKVIQIPAADASEIDVTAALLQEFMNKVEPKDVKKLLLAVKKDPSIVKSALKFL